MYGQKSTSKCVGIDFVGKSAESAETRVITAAAGTELADAYSYSTFKYVHVHMFIPI